MVRYGPSKKEIARMKKENDDWDRKHMTDVDLIKQNKETCHHCGRVFDSHRDFTNHQATKHHEGHKSSFGFISGY